ncbi:hypothetical protein ALC56_03103 [Trachymyrmex septentrionalis]|uniref:Uncharacterized protein n=1 Tax=Trachymyrmex septentrionalis TaxID=34720 RepID=A0A151K021_9HYME|nr:hypothetical protein ALC56_03103 [Trachymyrmex septentrionalis]
MTIRLSVEDFGAVATPARGFTVTPTPDVDVGGSCGEGERGIQGSKSSAFNAKYNECCIRDCLHAGYRSIRCDPKKSTLVTA